MRETIDGTAGSAVPRIRRGSRREFLKGTVVLAGTLSAGTLLAALAPSRTWALEAQVLDKGQARDLLLMAKRLYPHEDLPDAVYALLVKDIDEACRAAPVRDLVRSGLEALNRAADGHWAAAAPGRQVEILEAMRADPFFQKVRGQCITSIYDNQMAYKHFGYEGETWSKGGYIKRGFNDLNWLPDPPVSASPPPFDA
ncbi:tat (twin-arginine translocation) pathway signal sequence [Castellaniella sp. GW247-6E4]|uniref:tat (twin-arginine translocation) pathway signal sequence n=1 Tax=Castellaniella sp. GW247-6E4 TaxID=3140380 RepID=UPI0033161BE2